MRYLPAGLILACALPAAGFSSPATAQPRIHLPEEQPPPVLERIGAPEGLTTLTISPGGDRAAAALIAETEQVRSTVLLFSTDSEEPASLELNGRVRDLLFAPDSHSVLALLHRPAKKREGDTYLMRIELSPPRARRVMRLPPSARGLDFWPERNALLVASRNEIRTLTLPDLRSGPLYRVAGENLAVASLGSGGLILVGQETALLLLDLDDPPGEIEMPVRERVVSDEAILSLAAAADGSRALARLADGEVHAVELRPLRLAATGVPGSVAVSEKATVPIPVAPRADRSAEPPASSPVAPAVSAAPRVEPEERSAGVPPETPVEIAEEEAPVAPPAEPVVETVAETAPPAEPDTGPETEPSAAVEPEPAPDPEPPPPPRPVEPREARAVPESAEPVVDRPSPETRIAAPAPPVEPAERPAPAASHQVRGKIGGPAAGEVVAVVFLGPDNVLHEALRVVPDEDGAWSADGLAPGRYRVQLDGGGSRVIVSQPSFLLLEITAGDSIDADEIRALQAL